MRKDDRTETQKDTHRYLIVGTDSFMSGWGRARGGSSFAAWACETLEDAKRCMKEVDARSDMKRVRMVYDSPTSRYRPKCAHLHIYVWDPEQGGFFS